MWASGCASVLSQEQTLHTPVSSDGTPVRVTPFAEPVSRPATPGTGVVGAASEADCRAAAEPPAPEIRGGIIDGKDDLINVADVLAPPNRAIVFISSQLGTCTGWMYGDRIVATAGHCLHTGGKSGIWAPDITVSPARSGPSRPFGIVKVKRLYSVKGWTEEKQESADYGALLLSCDIGQRTGTFGYGWTRESRKGHAVMHAGYPGRAKSMQQQAPGVVLQEIGTQLFYDADSWMGMSGGPVFSLTPCVNCALAIHTDIKHPAGQGQPPFTELNHGVALTRAVFENLEAWKNLP